MDSTIKQSSTKASHISYTLSGISILVIAAVVGWVINMFIDLIIGDFGATAIIFIPSYLVMVIPVSILNRFGYRFFHSLDSAPMPQAGLFGIVAALLLVMAAGLVRIDLFREGIPTAGVWGYMVSMAVSYIVALFLDRIAIRWKLTK